MRARAVVAAIETTRFQRALRLVSGRYVLTAFEELDRVTRHDGGDGVLVDELRVAIASQQHTKIVEPGYDPLQFDAVDQENGERRLVLADMVEEGVLKILCAVLRHCGDPFFVRGPLPATLFAKPRTPPDVLFIRTWTAPLQGSAASSASISWSNDECRRKTALFPFAIIMDLRSALLSFAEFSRTCALSATCCSS